VTTEWKDGKPTQPQTGPMPAPKRPDPGQPEIKAPTFPPKPTTGPGWEKRTGR
jgi:hypothetical protein